MCPASTTSAASPTVTQPTTDPLNAVSRTSTPAAIGFTESNTPPATVSGFVLSSCGFAPPVGPAAHSFFANPTACCWSTVPVAAAAFNPSGTSFCRTHNNPPTISTAPASSRGFGENTVPDKVRSNARTGDRGGRSSSLSRATSYRVNIRRTSTRAARSAFAFRSDAPCSTRSAAAAFAFALASAAVSPSASSRFASSFASFASAFAAAPASVAASSRRISPSRQPANFGRPTNVSRAASLAG